MTPNLKPPPSPDRWPHRHAIAGREILTVAIAGMTLGALWSAWSGQDLNWDLRNYYYYSVYAWLSDQVTYHIAPGQLQTWTNPLVYLPKYLLINHVSPLTAGILIGAFEGLALVLVYALARIVIQMETLRLAVAVSLISAAAGFGGPEFLEGVGRVSGDILPSLLVLGALLAILSGAGPGRTAAGKTLGYAISGLLLGAAVGLKLTLGPYAVGLTATLLILWPRLRFRGRHFLMYAAGGVLGFLLTGGYWSWFLWQHYGNPIFPYYNATFHSPLAVHANFRDVRYLPPNLEAAISYPFEWLIGQTPLQGEIRDVRFAVLTVLLPIALLTLAANRISRARSGAAERQNAPLLVSSEHFWLLVLFFVISYICWLGMFSILRYLVPLGLLSGLMLFALLDRILPTNSAKVTVFAALVLMAVAWIRVDNSERLPYSRNWFGIQLAPELSEPNALFVMMGDAPASYVLPFLPQSDRAVRISGNFPLDPQDGLGLQAREIITGHQGPLRSLTSAALGPRDWYQLARFGLDIDESRCVTFRSRIDRFTSCPLRLGAPHPFVVVDLARQRIAWNAAAVPSARLYVRGDDQNRQLFAEATLGEAQPDWLRPGQRYIFELFEWQGGRDGKLLATAVVDEQGRMTQRSFTEADAPPGNEPQQGHPE